jgi:methylthioribose-1-phosphate isomerase
VSGATALRWRPGCLELLDQRALPAEERWVPHDSAAAVAASIRDMVVRGAPAIGIAAAYGLALTRWSGEDRAAADRALRDSRPTAVNLAAALDHLIGVPDPALADAAAQLWAADRAANEAMGAHAAHLLTGGVLTICNTGALATGGHGTALGVVRSARAAGAAVEVFALETRPFLQGARLTAWECARDGIPCTLLTDGMAGALMATGRVSAVIVGCDRVAANGDTANKIGTYGLAVLARAHGLPFYVAMPTSTLDRATPTGAQIPIEQRPADELRRLGGAWICPADTPVWNPGFDLTPAKLVTAWLTEHGVWRLPFPAPAA